ncbi:hypothetical protein BS47DRAFT_1336381 [Hydnum rufescens UP504]|uniref:Uncharacterized protein n=1 Tax=Hydnum rufescens UP504 TaxID=1448309 RepID=A0A9P6B982_9AGAM|nr:hypothetical protein BS47DRAFT_1336381 [Hydnum rufescens UP504]
MCCPWNETLGAPEDIEKRSINDCFVPDHFSRSFPQSTSTLSIGTQEQSTHKTPPDSPDTPKNPTGLFPIPQRRFAELFVVILDIRV